MYNDIKHRCGFNINNKYNLILNSVQQIKIKICNNGDKFKLKMEQLYDFIHVLDLAQIHVLLLRNYINIKYLIVIQGFVREILNKFSYQRKKIKFIIGNKRLKILLYQANPIKLMKYIS